jgi:hypothetical protein
VAALLPTFRWESGEPAQTADVVPLHGRSEQAP